MVVVGRGLSVKRIGWEDMGAQEWGGGRVGGFEGMIDDGTWLRCAMSWSSERM
jgi:hypothetical protein